MGWNTGDSERERFLARARRVADRSDHHAATEALLSGTGQFSTTFYLYDRPAVAYLDEGERVRFAFYNEMKGLGVGDERETYSPDTNGISIVLLTDRRVLGLVGQADGDHERSLAYDLVTDARYATAELHNRLVVETVRETFHFWINREFDEGDLQAAVSFVREQSADPWAILEESDGEDSPFPTGEEDDDPAPGGPTAGSVASDGGVLDDPDGPGEETDPLERIEKLHSLKEAGAITEAEYEQKKAELLDQV